MPLGCGTVSGDELPPLLDAETPGSDGCVDAPVDARPADDARRVDAVHGKDTAAKDRAVPDSSAADAGVADSHVGDAPTPVDGRADGPPQELSYFCLVTAEDEVWKYAMYLKLKSPVPAGESWAAEMEFEAAPGTDPRLESARRNECARSWPQNYQNIPDYARKFMATYSAGLAQEGPTSGRLSLVSHSCDLPLANKGVIFPMTHVEDGVVLPPPIEWGTANEAYPALETALGIKVSCLQDNPPACQIFQGRKTKGDGEWQIIDPPSILSLGILCAKDLDALKSLLPEY